MAGGRKSHIVLLFTATSIYLNTRVILYPFGFTGNVFCTPCALYSAYSCVFSTSSAWSLIMGHPHDIMYLFFPVSFFILTVV